MINLFVQSFNPKKRSIIPTPKTQFLIDGDSMSAFNNNGTMTADQTWAEHLRDTLDPEIWGDWYNSAVGGHTIAQMLANVVTEIDNRKSDTFERHVVSCLMGINSIYRYINIDSLTAQQAFEETRDDLITYHTGRNNAGFITVAFTITATQNPIYPTIHTIIEEARVLYNVWIRDNWQTSLNAGVLVDLDDTVLGGYNGCLNETYYQTDKIHWNDTGRQLVADFVKAKLPSLPLSDPAV